MDLAGFFETLGEVWPLLANGLTTTLYVTVISLVVAMFLGIFVCLMNLSKIAPLRGIAKFYIWIIRGTPMLVQAFYFYFAVPQLLQATIAPDFRLDVVTASIITLILNAGAYISDMRKIILPQAVRICLPSLVNQCIITLKDSTIMYAIGLPEIMNQAKVYVGRTFESFATYTWVAVIFLAITSVLMIVSSQLEKRMRK